MKLFPSTRLRQILAAFSLTLPLALPVFSSAATFVTLPLEGNGTYQDPDNLILNNLRGDLGPDQGTSERDIKQSRDNAQTFTLSSAVTIDKIAINFQNAGSSSTDFTTFEFFSVLQANASPLTPVSILDSVTFAPDELGMAAGTLVFDVTNAAATTGSSFGIRFDTEPTTPLVFKWKFYGEYTGGEGYENGAIRTDNAEADEDYTLGVVAVPEPSAVLLLAIAGAGLAARRRR